MIDEDLVGKELYKFLVANKKILIAEKKAAMKQADPILLTKLFVDREGNISKAAPEDEDGDEIYRMCIVNTTMIRDSHKDVHINGLWKKTLAESKGFYLLQEHMLTFKGIITDEVKAFTKTMSWKSLGLDAEGNTEALVFDVAIPKDRNPYMYEQYKQNRVNSHSVGMLYGRIELALNDEDYKEEFAVWNKYIDNIVNKEEVKQDGFYWAITQAKLIEGSAVPIGSNRITPTLSTTGKSKVASQSSVNIDTPPAFDLLEAIKNTTFLTH